MLHLCIALSSTFKHMLKGRFQVFNDVDKLAAAKVLPSRIYPTGLYGWEPGILSFTDQQPNPIWVPNLDSFHLWNLSEISIPYAVRNFLQSSPYTSHVLCSTPSSEQPIDYLIALGINIQCTVRTYIDFLGISSRLFRDLAASVSRWKWVMCWFQPGRNSRIESVVYILWAAAV